jgi:uncharacterized protein with NRDE domain
MCLLALFFRVFEEAPIVIGANREERHARRGEPPQILEGRCRSAGGVDPVAGGTWLGVNERGVLAAVTNRAKSVVPEQPPSRGLLVRDLLDCPDAAGAIALARQELETNRFAGCNLLVVDQSRACVLEAGDWLRIHPLPPGLHVVTAGDVNDPADARLRYARDWLSEQGPANAAECVGKLKELCAQPGNGTPPICIHGEQSGTISSSILALGARQGIYWHAQGPPDTTPYRDFSHLLAALGLAKRVTADGIA